MIEKTNPELLTRIFKLFPLLKFLINKMGECINTTVENVHLLSASEGDLAKLLQHLIVKNAEHDDKSHLDDFESNVNLIQMAKGRLDFINKFNKIYNTITHDYEADENISQEDLLKLAIETVNEVRSVEKELSLVEKTTTECDENDPEVKRLYQTIDQILIELALEIKSLSKIGKLPTDEQLEEASTMAIEKLLEEFSVEIVTKYALPYFIENRASLLKMMSNSVSNVKSETSLPDITPDELHEHAKAFIKKKNEMGWSFEKSIEENLKVKEVLAKKYSVSSIEKGSLINVKRLLNGEIE